MTSRRGRLLPALLAVALFAACSGGDPIAPSGEPQAVAIVQGSGQAARYGTLLPVTPRVIVSGEGGPLVDYPVAFTVVSGGGTLTGASARTNTEGVATLGSWTLGPTPGDNSIRATAGTKGVTLTATALTGPPSAFVIVAGNGQTVSTTQRAPVAPVVQVTDGNFGVAGITVTFTVTGGDGTVTPSTGVTDADGRASTVWRMGPDAGANAITAAATGLPAVTLGATAVPLVISAFTAVDGDNAVAFVNNFADRLPRVEVRDQLNAPVEGATVTFAVQGGGGSVPFSSVATDLDGRATPGAWRFGAAGPQSLGASVAGGAPVTFSGNATTAPPGAYNIDLRFLTPLPTADQQAAFLAARTKWQQIVIGDVTDFPGDLQADGCGEPSGSTPSLPAVSGPIDDIVIFAGIRPIDGVRNILAQAGPCLVRASSGLTLLGVMIFDSSDLDLLEARGGLGEVATHEMAHVLGLGTLGPWDQLLVGAGGTDPYFTGSATRQAFAASQSPASPFTGNSVPVENTGGAGTRDGHWRESVFGSELMTGFYDSGVANPLSAVSAASLRDLGYVVDDSRTEAFTLPLRLGAWRAGPPTGLQLVEALAPWPITAVDGTDRPVGQLRR
jgi:hypothetical protein